MELKKLKLKLDVFNAAKHLDDSAKQYLVSNGLISSKEMYNDIYTNGVDNWHRNVLACHLDNPITNVWVPQSQECCQ